MVIIDYGLVISVTERSRRVPIDQLRWTMDPDSPYPLLLWDPSGLEVFFFMVDFHRSPRVTCERMGFEYRHLLYMDRTDELYQPSAQIVLGNYTWLKAFLFIWVQDREDRERAVQAD